MNRRLTIALRVLAIAAVAVALWWFVRTINFADLGTALRTAKAWPLVLAAALNFVCLWGKAACWRIMLAPRHHVSTLRLFRYTIAAFAASAIAPARAGEVLRVWALKRRDGVPVAETAAVAVAEKLLDAISMMFLIAPVPWLLSGLPRWVSVAIATCGAVAFAAFAVLWFAIGKIRPTGSFPAIRRFINGMHVLRSPRRLLGSLGVLMIVWAADLGEIMSVLYAVDVHLPVAAGILILFSLNLTIMIPSTPASVGALELGALAALELLHVGHEQALAFALLYHMLQIIPLLAVGLLFELRLVLGRDGQGRGDPGLTPPVGLPTVPAATRIAEPAARGGDDVVAVPHPPP